jgi:hypothetical protein
MKQEPVLQNLFMYLVEEGFPIGIRDYKAALEALRRGYGLHHKENLLWLCKTLWARTEEEKRFLNTLFSQFSFSLDEKTKELINECESYMAGDSEQFPSHENMLSSNGNYASIEAEPARVIDFASATSQRSGIGLTSARVESGINEYFILSPHLIVSLRRLTVIWRRYKEIKREGPRVELDVEATVEEKCRQGILSQPVFIPARRNQAKLVILIDVSTSMTPWYDFNKALVKSLERGQLGEARIFYFHNVPENNLYERETLTKPKKIADAARESQNSALLIISDCGAARGYKNRERISETRQFLSGVSRFWHPVVWLNPMPTKRWEKTTAEVINQSLRVNMYELNEEGLIKAIDYLRGKRIN